MTVSPARGRGMMLEWLLSTLEIALRRVGLRKAADAVYGWFRD